MRVYAASAFRKYAVRSILVDWVYSDAKATQKGVDSWSLEPYLASNNENPTQFRPKGENINSLCTVNY